MGDDAGNRAEELDDSFENAEEKFRKICAEIMQNNPRRSSKKQLFPSANKMKTNLRPSLIDRACPKLKFVSSTPMVHNKKMTFTSDEADMSSITNTLDEKSGPSSQKLNPPNLLKDKEASVVSVSSAASCDTVESGVGKNSNNGSSTSRSNHKNWKTSRLEQIVDKIQSFRQEADPATSSKNVQTSDHILMDERVVKQPKSPLVNLIVKGRERQTQTGASLGKQSDSSSLDQTPINKVLDKKNSRAPWRAPSELQEPSKAHLSMDFYKYSDESLDDTFRPKLKKKRSVFFNKKKGEGKGPTNLQKKISRSRNSNAKSEVKASRIDNTASECENPVKRMSKNRKRLSSTSNQINNSVSPARTLYVSLTQGLTDEIHESPWTDKNTSRQTHGRRIQGNGSRSTKRDQCVQIETDCPYEQAACRNHTEKHKCVASKTHDQRNKRDNLNELGENIENVVNKSNISQNEQINSSDSYTKQLEIENVKRKIGKTAKHVYVQLNRLSNYDVNTSGEEETESCRINQNNKKQIQCRSEDSLKKRPLNCNVKNLEKNEKSLIQERTYETWDPIMTSLEKNKTGKKRRKPNRSSRTKERDIDLGEIVPTASSEATAQSNKNRSFYSNVLEAPKKQAQKVSKRNLCRNTVNSSKSQENNASFLQTDEGYFNNPEEAEARTLDDECGRTTVNEEEHNIANNISNNSGRQQSFDASTNVQTQKYNSERNSNNLKTRRGKDKGENLESHKKNVKGGKKTREPDISANQTQTVPSLQSSTSSAKTGKKVTAKVGGKSTERSSNLRNSKPTKERQKKGSQKKNRKTEVHSVSSPDYSMLRRSTRERRPPQRQRQCYIACSSETELKRYQKLFSCSTTPLHKTSKSTSTKTTISPIQEECNSQVEDEPHYENSEVPIASSSKSRVKSGRVSKKKSKKTDNLKFRDAVLHTITTDQPKEVTGLLNDKFHRFSWVYKHPEQLKFESLAGMIGVSSAMLNGGCMGFLKIDAGRIKKKQIAQSHNLTFLVVDGRAMVGVDNQECICNQLESFSIPAGVQYYIKNTSDDQQLLLSFSKVPKLT